MLQILNQYIQGEQLVTEYTKDGITVSHTVITLIEQETEGDIIEIPRNPLLELQKENAELRQRLALADERLSLAEKAIDELIFGGGF